VERVSRENEKIMLENERLEVVNLILKEEKCILKEELRYEMDFKAVRKSSFDTESAHNS
jgi:hypothetical protein